MYLSAVMYFFNRAHTEGTLIFWAPPKQHQAGPGGPGEGLEVVPGAFRAEHTALNWGLGSIGLYWGYIGIMEKKMETTTLFRV